jgi:hypothetical protein
MLRKFHRRIVGNIEKIGIMNIMNIMNKRTSVILAVLFVSVGFLIAPLQAWQKAGLKEVRATSVVQPGERLTYSVKWNDLLAAKVVMTADQAGDKQYGNAHRVEVKVDTVGMVKDIIKVSDRFTAFLDPKTDLPFRAERDILEGPKTEQGFTLFDQDKHLATVADTKPVSIAPETHDIASLFWAIRNVDLKASANEKIHAFNSGEKKMFATFIEVGKREQITTSKGKYQTVQLVIKLQDQKPSADKQKPLQPTDKYAIRMWVTDDAQRLPVLITAQPPFGKIQMELVETAPAQEAKISE